MNCSALQLGLPDWAGNMAQSGNPGGELRRVSDIPTEKCEGSRGLRSDGVGLRMTETEKYKLGLKVWFLRSLSQIRCYSNIWISDCRLARMWLNQVFIAVWLHTCFDQSRRWRGGSVSVSLANTISSKVWKTCLKSTPCRLAAREMCLLKSPSEGYIHQSKCSLKVSQKVSLQ